jgi:hypothetical protein
VGRRLNGSLEEADGRRAAGEAGKAGGGAAVGRGEVALEVGDGPDGWAPSVGEREGERKGSGPREEMGQRYLGPLGGFGFLSFFSFSFSNRFQTNFSNHFQIKSFPYFNTNLSNYFKTFRKPFKQLFRHF